MQKIMVIGCPGSGKSTFSCLLHEKTGIPLVHLDMLNWNADRTVVPREVFLQRLSDAMKKDAWIIDGNYGASLEMRLKESDTVIFLDYPVEVCLSGIESRKGKPRCDMPWIENPEDTEDTEFIEFIKNYNKESKPKVLDLLKKYPDKNVIIFKTREESADFLKNSDNYI